MKNQHEFEMAAARMHSNDICPRIKGQCYDMLAFALVAWNVTLLSCRKKLVRHGKTALNQIEKAKKKNQSQIMSGSDV